MIVDSPVVNGHGKPTSIPMELVVLQEQLLRGQPSTHFTLTTSGLTRGSMLLRKNFHTHVKELLVRPYPGVYSSHIMKSKANKFLHRSIKSYLSSSHFSWVVVSSLQIGCPHEGHHPSGSLNNMNLIERLPPVYSPTISNKKIRGRMFLYSD